LIGRANKMALERRILKYFFPWDDKGMKYNTTTNQLKYIGNFESNCLKLHFTR